MAVRLINDDSLVAVADAIRAKTGSEETMEFPQGFVDAIGAIEAGGGGGSDVLIVPGLYFSKTFDIHLDTTHSGGTNNERIFLEPDDDVDQFFRSLPIKNQTSGSFTLFAVSFTQNLCYMGEGTASNMFRSTRRAGRAEYIGNASTFVTSSSTTVDNSSSLATMAQDGTIVTANSNSYLYFSYKDASGNASEKPYPVFYAYSTSGSTGLSNLPAGDYKCTYTMSWRKTN